MLPDLARVHAVTANLFFWQGLRFVPLGLGLVLLSASYASWWPLADAWHDPFLIVLLVTALSASSAIGTYYGRAYGRVRGVPGAHATRTRMKWLVVYPAMALSLIADGVLAPPVFISGLVWGVGILLYWWSTGRGRLHYPGAALLSASAVAWPALGFSASGVPTVNLFMGLIGIIYVICGVLDHLELKRVLRSIPDDA
ncbi:MAG TPA: hypothetical protein VJ672_12775 [Gemmatimonadaceae bacterium]|nr:hypothetical protein [Gemmatimonadaceae bacterium]